MLRPIMIERRAGIVGIASGRTRVKRSDCLAKASIAFVRALLP